MTHVFKTIPAILVLLILLSCSGGAGADMEKDWRFFLGEETAACQVDFNDKSWEKLDLPHDWAFVNGYSEDGAQGDRGGYASGGIGWYRKHFKMTAAQLKDSRHFLDFDGVYMNSEVWVNGQYLGKRPYGYISFSYEITDQLRKGDNVIAVRVDNSLEPSARWYHGCGIYGEVRLTRTALARIDRNSIQITTPSVSPACAEVAFKAAADVRNPEELEGLTASWTILSPEGLPVAGEEITGLISLTQGIHVDLQEPEIWDLDTPDLYTLVLKLRRGDVEIAQEKVRFGVRSIAWEPETGFHLNGRVVKLQGVCEHLEGGPVGAAWTKDLLRWKLQLLKDMGCNSIRTAHNPQLPFFYDLCDEMGILVMDECFDGWGVKAKYDYGMQAFKEWWERDLRAFLRRDRNHPSVILWSMGNETKGEVAADLVRVCHEEDPTRLVTSGHSGSEYMDVFGVNGSSEKKHFIETYQPGDKAFVGTETPHTWQVRGYYRSKTWYRDGFPNRKQDPFVIPDLTDDEIFNYEWAPVDKWTNVKQHFNSSYDNATVRLTARHNIEFLRDLPWYSGNYRWTGFDYLGEAGYVHGGWPFRAFMGGALDMAGFRKDLYYLYQAEWTDAPMVHILPHWTHPYMKEGTLVPVVVYTNAEEVQLYVNGVDYGRRSKGAAWDEMALEWLVPWTPGRLEAIAYAHGAEVARTTQTTAAAPAALGLSLQDLTVCDPEERTLILTVAQEDEVGTLYPYGENRVYFHFPETVKVLSLENGNPVDVETNWNARSKTAFFGLLRGFVTVPAEESASLTYIGAILGDKRLKLSDQITIDVQTMDLVSGTCGKADVEIRYTLDGSTPSRKSLLYEGGFSVAPGTTVRATVYEKGRKLLDMSEKFGPEEGLCWNLEGNAEFQLRGMQAEMLYWTGFHKTTAVKGFEGECCLEADELEAELAFYQENDGSRKMVPLRIRLLHKAGTPVVEVLNNNQPVAKTTLESQPSAQWQILEMKIPLVNGANQIDLRFKGLQGNLVDWVELAE